MPSLLLSGRSACGMKGTAPSNDWCDRVFFRQVGSEMGTRAVSCCGGALPSSPQSPPMANMLTPSLGGTPLYVITFENLSRVDSKKGTCALPRFSVVVIMITIERATQLLASESTRQSITASRLSRAQSQSQWCAAAHSCYLCIELYGTCGDETQSTINIHQSNQRIWYSVHGCGELEI
ncbi:hypothetical protein BC827DRAFT_2121 [Russula dissimulans]|nr:hypothetical protein BC827DRAFT_2121 [Russula dissimulans]